MGFKFKAGTNFIIPVGISDTNFANISAIEFVFTQDMKGNSLKTAYWSRDGQSRDAALSNDAENTILVSFSREDTYKFKENSTFYMDTRIHYTESNTNPYTKIVPMQMTETLFADGEEVTADG